MKYSLDLLKNTEKFNPKLFFYAGVLKARTDLDIQDIISLLSMFFTDEAAEKVLSSIENLMINGNFGEMMKKLKEFKCDICKKLDISLIRLSCGDSFHLECLIKDISENLTASKEYICFSCKKADENIESIHPKISDIFLTHENASLVDHGNLRDCPRCSTFCEIDRFRRAECQSCLIKFCGNCEKNIELCKCRFAEFK